MEIQLYRPYNLRMDEILEAYPPACKTKPSKFYYIITQLLERPAFDADLMTEDGYIPLNAQMLQYFTIRNYKFCLKYLQEHGIIECDRHYIEGKKAYGYRLTARYQTHAVPVIVKDWPMYRKISKHRKACQKAIKKFPELYKWFNPNLKLDWEQARIYLKLKLLADLQAGEKNAVRKYNASYLTLQKIRKNDWLFSQDDNVGRLHTLLTTLKSELRNFLTYDGQKLVSCDFVNSQPLIASALVRPEYHFWAENRAARDFTLTFQEISPKIRHNVLQNLPHSGGKYSASITLVENAVPLAGRDVQEFVRLCETGRIYEHIEAEYLRMTGRKMKGGRKGVKATIFQAFFSDNRFMGQWEAGPKRTFRDLFPTVYNLFAFIKRRKKNQLARLLQMTESRLMLERIVRRIAQERPDLPIYTIHDSIVTTQGNQLYVQQVMQEEMMKALGLSCKIKTENWSPDEINWTDLRIAAGVGIAA